MPVKSKEFDVVIMAAGKGTRLSEITDRKPKCLLPIGNFPMVYFSLKMFEDFGFEEAYLVVLEMDKIVIESAIQKTDLKLKLEVLTIPDDKDWGTTDTLRYMHSYFTHDVIVVSCDLVTNIDLNEVFQFHRKSDCSITAVYFHLQNNPPIVLPGRVSKVKLEKDILVLIPGTNELVFVGSSSEFNETINISNNLIKKYKHIQFRSDLQDAHLYIMKKGIINFLLLESNKDLSTLKGEAIPFIVKKQNSHQNRCVKLECDSKFEDSTTIADTNNRLTEINMLVELCKQPEYAVEALLMSSCNIYDDNLSIPNSVRPVKCCAYVASEEAIIIRADTIYGYCAINKLGSKVLKKLPGMLNVPNIWKGVEIESSKVEKSTCLIGSETKVLSNVILKTTTVGSRCLLKSNSRINGCIIMDDVIIEEDCTLNNCVICDNVTINGGSDLNNCIVGSCYRVLANSSFSKDVLTQLDKLMEI